MNAIIDANVYLFRWPFRRLRGDELSDLVAKFKKHGVTQAWAGSFEGLMHRDVQGVNERLAQACRQVRDLTLVPFGTVNPALPDWEEDLRRCTGTYKMPGIRLHPNYHGYDLKSPAFEALLRQCAQQRLLVQLVLCMEDERTQHPVFRVPPVDAKPLPELLKKIPNLRLMLLNAHQTLRAEALYQVISAGQVHVEIAMLEGINGVAHLTKNVPAERVLFGSLSPLFYFESALLKLQEADMPEPLRRAIRAGNAQKLLPAR